MKKYSKLLISSLMILGLVGVNACDDDEEIIEPTQKPTIQLDASAATKVVEADGQIVVNFSGTAPEGAENVVITSDADEDFSVTFPLEGATEFNQDYPIDVSAKTSGTETFTFTVTDSLSETASAEFVATYVEHIFEAGEPMGNAYTPDDDNLALTTPAYYSIMDPIDAETASYTRQQIIDAGEDKPRIDFFLFRDDLANDAYLLASATDRAEAANFIELLNNNPVTFEAIAVITEEVYNSINGEADLDLAYQNTLDAIANGTPADDDVNLGSTNEEIAFYAVRTSNGTVMALRSLFDTDGADLNNDNITLQFVAFK